MIFAIIGQLLVGWLIADFLTGVLHWLEDRVLTEATPLLGRTIVAPNRLHHIDPMAFTRKSFVDRNWSTWAVVGLVSGLWLFLLGPSVVWASATVGGMVASMVHYHTHRPTSGLLRALQDIGVVQSIRQHAKHHKPPSAGSYCVLTDWLNPLLDHLQVWARLERLLRRFGVRLAN